MKLPLIILASIVVTGCAGKQIETRNDVKLTEYEVSLVDFQQRMIKASNNAAESQEMMARVNNAVASNSVSKSQVHQATWQDTHKVPGLQSKISLDWVGSIEGFVRALESHLKGWDIRVLGLRPTTLPMISVFKKETPVQDILEVVGNQLGTRMDIFINGKSKVIKFIYMDEKYDN